MKKFISLVMAAAMVVSLVPATAFAKDGEVTGTVKVIDALEKEKDFTTVGSVEGYIDYTVAPEVQIKVKEVEPKQTDGAVKQDITLTLDGAKFADGTGSTKVADLGGVPMGIITINGHYASGNVIDADGAGRNITVTVNDYDETEISYTIDGVLEEDDVIAFDLQSVMDKTSAGAKAYVSVDTDIVGASKDDMVYASVLDYGISASVKKQANVAEEERTTLEKDLKISSNVGNFAAGGQDFELKLSKGFEFSFSDYKNGADYTIVAGDDDNKVIVTYTGGQNEFSIKASDLEIEATSAKAGAVATITVKAIKDKADPDTFSATATVEVAKVVDYKVVLSVDEDEDIPVIYSGVDVDNTGITDDSDHMSLEVTAEETFPGAWSMRKGFSFELPEGVYVTDVDVVDTENFITTKGGVKYGVDNQEWYDAFWNAYQEGDHVNFEFEKRVFNDVNTDLEDDPATVTFKLELVADPTFEGDVVLKLTGDLVDEQEVTIAKFVKPYTVKAEQNDLIIDYRYTEIPTAIVITEAEAGLWDKGAEFDFSIDDNGNNLIQFEDDATFEIDKDSELDIKDDTTVGGTLKFTVKSSSDEAATVTIKDMTLFMQRNIPAGPYDLTIDSSLARHYNTQMLFAPDETDLSGSKVVVSGDPADAGKDAPDMDDVVDDTDLAGTGVSGRLEKDNYVKDVCDYSSTVKEAFVNVVTAGRDQDDASFTTKIVVPIGESYLIAGEKEVPLDVPAYISADGYTMLPVRRVATALGINENNVLWDQATKTVTILYGQRIITMVAGQKVVYVNGSAIPASASVEIKDGRTFLPLRDLGTALGVTKVDYDPATKTASLN